MMPFIPRFWPTVGVVLWEDRQFVICVAAVLVLGVAADWAIDHGYLLKGQSTASECVCE